MAAAVDSLDASNRPSSQTEPSHTLSAAQIPIIKATVPILAQHGETITTRFYQNMLRAHPELNNIFNVSNMRNGRQPRALAGAVYAYAANIDNLGALSSAVELICNRHVSLFIQPEHYDTVGTYLLGAMKEILGDALTPDILDAWTTAYWQLADLFIAKEKEMYASTKEWKDWAPFKIARKVPESDEITSFYLEPVDSRIQPLPKFLPGQYISVRTKVPELQHIQPRQYSLSDAPNETYYRISVKREQGLNVQDPNAEAHQGYVSNVLHDLKNEGDVVEVSHPFGDFHFDPEAESADAPVVLVSAGVGLTCLTSIFNALLQEKSTRPISFIHGARSSSLRAFGDHVRKADAERENVHTVLFNKNVSEGDKKGVHYNHEGRLDITKLDKETDLHLDNAKTQYFVCGPDTFMVDVEESLKKLGVAAERIHSERYGPSG